jgi:DNA repair protein RecO (recombination protein O)
MPSYTTDCIVLRRLDFGETDRILTLFSKEHGKIAAIAKGARKPLSKFAGVSEVMTRAECQLGTGKSLDILSQTEIISTFTGIRQDLVRMAHGLYLVDLVDHATEDRHPNPELFHLLDTALNELKTAKKPDILARWFEVRLLDNLGYLPDITNCVICQCETPGSFPDDLVYGLSISQGGVVCPDDLSWDVDSDHYVLSLDALSFLEVIVLSTSPADTEKWRPEPADHRQVRVAIRQYIRYRLERELKSLQFLDSVSPDHL